MNEQELKDLAAAVLNGEIVYHQYAELIQTLSEGVLIPYLIAELNYRQESAMADALEHEWIRWAHATNIDLEQLEDDYDIAECAADDYTEP